MSHYENQYSAGQVQTDEYGNPIRHSTAGQVQTDEYGNPIRQTDEYGNPVHRTGGTMGDYGTIGAYGTQAAGHTTGVHGGEQRQHGTLGGMLHRSGSSSSSSSVCSIFDTSISTYINLSFYLCVFIRLLMMFNVCGFAGG